MAAHDYHEGLSGFSEGQILHDGCGECERRGSDASIAIAHLDKGNFRRAWVRAAQWNREGLADLSRAEIPLLRALWSVQVKLEAYQGFRIGSLPVHYSPESL